MVITGPAKQIGLDTFRVSMRRGDDGGDIWIEEENDGNRIYRKEVQPGKLEIPSRLTEGTPQQIHFEPIPDMRLTAAPIHLRAWSTSGLPVRFYINYGPAQIVGDRLTVTQFPRFARCPIEVEVIAYQWGRMADKFGPAIQSAESVSRKFRIDVRSRGNVAPPTEMRQSPKGTSIEIACYDAP